MTPEQIAVLIAAITGLAGVVVGAFGLWLGYRAPTTGFQEALHVKQVEGAIALLHSMILIDAQIGKLAISRLDLPVSPVTRGLNITSEESDKFVALIFEAATEVQPWQAIMPRRILEAADRCLEAAWVAADDLDKVMTWQLAYEALVTATRQELGVEPLSGQTLALFRSAGVLPSKP